jgi:hypothetical protein
MLKSRMEIGSEQDYSKVLCSCAGILGEHDWPAGKCLGHHVSIINVITGKIEQSIQDCECKNFERAIETSEDNE